MNKPRLEITVALARAAATDAGNRNMRKNGRTKWTREDTLAAARVFFRLCPEAAILPGGKAQS